MPKVKISEYSATANSNTDVASINIDEGCAPSGINNAIRAVMGHLKDFQQGTYGDPFNGPHNGTLGATTASTANVTTLTTSSTVTHNGGTANGVAYLNGSKVLTTGSALTFDGGSLGVGTSSPTTKLDVLGSGDGEVRIRAGSDAALIFSETTANKNWKLKPSAGDFFWQYSATAYNSGYSALMALTSSGNLGIGTTAPLGKLHVSASGLSTIYMSDTGEATNQKNWTFQYGTGVGTGTFRLRALNDANNAGQNAYIITRTGVAVDTHQWLTADTERARIDSSGNLLVGGTVTEASAKQLIRYTSGSNGLAISTPDDINGTDFITFKANNAVCGYINRVGTTSAVMYTSASDYRLKENIQPMTGALSRLAQLKPCTYTWKSDGSAGEGFIAHELAEVCPHAVTGEKDAVNEDGSIKSQGIDTSFLIGVLTAAIKEQQALITQLQADVAALKGA